MVKPDNLRIIMAFRGRNGQPPRPDLAWQRLKTAHIVQQQTTFLVVSRRWPISKWTEVRQSQLTGHGPRTSRSAAWTWTCPCHPRCSCPLCSMGSQVLGPLIMIESRQLDTLTEDLLLSSLEQEEQRRDRTRGRARRSTTWEWGRSFSPKGRAQRQGPE